MTEIPAKQENQTWANYFIERLKERGVDTTIREKKFETSFNDITEHDLTCQLGIAPNVNISLGYVLDTSSSQGFPDDELNTVTNLKYNYDDDTTITIKDSSNGMCYLHVFNHEDTPSDFHARGTLEDLLPDGITAAEALCNLADFVKQRQDFYNQEGQK